MHVIVSLVTFVSLSLLVFGWFRNSTSCSSLLPWTSKSWNWGWTSFASRNSAIKIIFLSPLAQPHSGEASSRSREPWLRLCPQSQLRDRCPCRCLFPENKDPPLFLPEYLLIRKCIVDRSLVRLLTILFSITSVATNLLSVFGNRTIRFKLLGWWPRRMIMSSCIVNMKSQVSILSASMCLPSSSLEVLFIIKTFCPIISKSCL